MGRHLGKCEIISSLWSVLCENEGCKWQDNV